MPPGTVLTGILVTRLVYAAPARPLQDTGAEYSLHLNILFNSPRLSPLLPLHNPLAFLRKRPPAVISPVAQGGQATRHLQSKDTIWDLHLSPQVSGFLWSGFRAPCCLSQALCTCSLTGKGEVLSPSDRFQAVVSSLKSVLGIESFLIPKLRRYESQGMEWSYSPLPHRQAEAEGHSLSGGVRRWVLPLKVQISGWGFHSKEDASPSQATVLAVRRWASSLNLLGLVTLFQMGTLKMTPTSPSHYQDECP